jgi:hypothetical protein
MPDGCDFFYDPYKAIQHYKSCMLNTRKSGRHSLELADVYQYITGKTLVNAHNSLSDAKAQKTIMLDPRYKEKYFDTIVSIRPIEEALSAKERKVIQQWDELTRPVPKGWVEEPAGEETEWDPPPRYSYFGPNGGSKHGPTKAARDTAMAPGAKIMDLFLFIFPLWLLEMVVDHTNNYATCDFVQLGQKTRTERSEKRNGWCRAVSTTKGLATGPHQHILP